MAHPLPIDGGRGSLCWCYMVGITRLRYKCMAYAIRRKCVLRPVTFLSKKFHSGWFTVGAGRVSPSNSRTDPIHRVGLSASGPVRRERFGHPETSNGWPVFFPPQVLAGHLLMFCPFSKSTQLRLLAKQLRNLMEGGGTVYFFARRPYFFLAVIGNHPPPSAPPGAHSQSASACFRAARFFETPCPRRTYVFLPQPSLVLLAVHRLPRRAWVGPPSSGGDDREDIPRSVLLLGWDAMPSPSWGARFCRCVGRVHGSGDPCLQAPSLPANCTGLQAGGSMAKGRLNEFSWLWRLCAATPISRYLWSLCVRTNPSNSVLARRATL